MPDQPTPATCEHTSCRQKAKWLVTKLPAGGRLRTCDQHRPDALPGSEESGGRVWYHSRPIRAWE